MAKSGKAWIAMNRSRFSILTSLTIIFVTCFYVTLLTGCGNKQAFKSGSVLEAQAPGGDFEIPAKADILLAEDDTGSMFEAFETIETQIPSFLTKLESSGWDYHFATIPLTHSREISQVLASKYDGNWGSEWKPPYPGAVIDSPGMQVLPWAFKAPDTYSDFIQISDISNTDNQKELGFQTIKDVLYSPSTRESGFLRPDAMLVVLVMSNGNDSSGVRFCRRSDGWEGPCYGSDSASFQGWKDDFLKIRSNNWSRDIKFFSAVSSNPQNNCLGARAFAGERYKRMAQELTGASIDICNQPIESVLETMGNHLESIRIGFRISRLIIEAEPDTNTIEVIKYIGGDTSKPVKIPGDPVNGWTYEGYKTVYTIDWPVEMNQATGYVIELHGSAKLSGKDTSEVNFKPLGGKDSAEK